MKLFQHTLDAPPLGPLLREAREARGFSLEQSALEIRLSVEALRGLEADCPLDPRRARLQAVSYSRFLGLNPAEIRDSLPPLPELSPNHQQFISNASRQPKTRHHSPLEMLAPMGKFALTLILVTALLGTWGLVHKISRVRSIPGLTSNTSVSDLFFR